MLAAMRVIAAIVCSLLLVSCVNTGDRRQPIPSQAFPGTEPGNVLVVVLPGRWDDLRDMAEAGMPDAIHAAWPEIDVLLVGAALDYYLDGGLAKRLHEQIVAPAKSRGYRQIWMAGASLGGMGTLLYDREYPDELQGLVLLAPYLGNQSLIEEIRQAGGITEWQAGPVPSSIDRSNFQNEVWRYLQSWADQPARGRRVWLAYGDDDRLRDAVPVIAPLLPKQHVLKRSGGHTWGVWVPAAEEIFRSMAQHSNAETLN